MMMLPDKKKAASAILERLKPEMPKVEVEVEVEKKEPQSDVEMAKEDAAKKMIEAFEKKDPKKFAAYLSDFIYFCESEDKQPENDEE